MKKSDKKQYTDEQIESMQEVLGEEITNLNNRINEQADTGEFQTKEINLTDEIKVSEITEIREDVYVPTITGDSCKFCAYQDVCPSFVGV